MVAVGKRALDFDGALGRCQGAVELDQERVTNGFYFSAVKPRKDFPKQPAMFLQEFLGKLFIPLAERAVTHHVGKHDGGEFALLIGAHFSVSAFPNSRLRRETVLAQLRVSCPDDRASNSTGNRNLLSRLCALPCARKARCIANSG